MLILVSGGNGSGKSRYAEKLISSMDYPRYYLATMIPYGESGKARVEKHINQRKDLGFITIETPYLYDLEEIPEGAIVLLEDVSNAVANRFFEKKENWESVYRDILKLEKACKTLVMVTITGFGEGDYDGETAQYIRALNSINDELRKASDVVYEMRDGNPVCLKGEAL